MHLIPSPNTTPSRPYLPSRLGLIGLSSVVCSLLLTSCVSLSPHPQPQLAALKKQITSSDDISAYDLAQAIDSGDNAFLAWSQIFQKADHAMLQEAEHILVSLIDTNTSHWNLAQLRRALKLYGFTKGEYALVVFAAVMTSPLKESQHMAWTVLYTSSLADHHQSLEQGKAFVDNYLSQALLQQDIEQHLIPQMAFVVRKWNITDLYDIIHMALRKKGDEVFAQTMAELNAQKASNDFLSYLSLAPDEDLRQLHFQSLNSDTVLVMLEHLRHHPPHFGHQHLGKLFVYAASRQIAIKEKALMVLDQLTPIQPQIMAYDLSQQPVWVQVALIEQAERSLTPNLGVLLRHLGHITTDTHIADEIALLKL